MKCNASPVEPEAVGDVPTGSGSRMLSRIIRSLPLRSATRTVCASGNARLQGGTVPVATGTTRILPPCTSRICGPPAIDTVCCAQLGAPEKTSRTRSNKRGNRNMQGIMLFDHNMRRDGSCQAFRRKPGKPGELALRQIIGDDPG